MLVKNFDLILEQNALLWRMHPGKKLEGSTVVSTKMVRLDF